MLHQRAHQQHRGASQGGAARALPVPVPACSSRSAASQQQRSVRGASQAVVHSIRNGSDSATGNGATGATRVQDPQTTIATLQAELKMLRLQMASLVETVDSLSESCDVAAPPVRRLSREDYELLPHRIILLRHAESKGNVDRDSYSRQPDHTVPLTDRGKQHARVMGQRLQDMLSEQDGEDHRVFIMSSPYCRTLETTDMILESFTDEQVVGVRQAVQLREQDFGNLQDPTRITQDLQDRQVFGRFWFRFPNGESGADVYDRLTIFEDHLTRDMLAGRFCGMSLVLVTHGLTLRLFLMRWFHWSVDEFLEVYNPPNCQPVVLEKLPWRAVQELQGKRYAHAKHCYHITPASRDHLRGVTTEMASYHNRKLIHGGCTPRMKWIEHRALMAERGLYGVAQHQAPLDSMDLRGGASPSPLRAAAAGGGAGPALSTFSCDEGGGEVRGGGLLSCEDAHLQRASRRLEAAARRREEGLWEEEGRGEERCEGASAEEEEGPLPAFCEHPEGWAPSPSPSPPPPQPPPPGRHKAAAQRQGAAAQ